MIAADSRPFGLAFRHDDTSNYAIVQHVVAKRDVHITYILHLSPPRQRLLRDRPTFGIWIRVGSFR